MALGCTQEGEHEEDEDVKVRRRGTKEGKEEDGKKERRR